MEERIIQLEKRAAFQEYAIEELNEALIHQQKECDGLKRQVNALIEKIQGGRFVKEVEDEEPPPHY